MGALAGWRHVGRYLFIYFLLDLLGWEPLQAAVERGAPLSQEAVKWCLNINEFHLEIEQSFRSPFSNIIDGLSRQIITRRGKCTQSSCCRCLESIVILRHALHFLFSSKVLDRIPERPADSDWFVMYISIPNIQRRKFADIQCCE